MVTPELFLGRREYLRPILDEVLVQSMTQRRIAVAAGILLLPVVGTLDLLTGYEVNFFVFYFLPIALLTWNGNRGAGIAMAFGCAVVWYWVDVFGADDRRLERGA